MSSFEKLIGSKVIDLLDDLIKAKTLVKVSTHNKNFEGLTVVLATRAEEEGMVRFQIDPPEGLWAVLRKLHQPVLRFEFLGGDRLPHRFEVSFKDLDEDGWLLCPEFIERYQLRNDFRIKAPVNAHATALINETEFKMPMDNISLGGIFCHCPNSAKAFLFKDQIIENLALMISFGGDYRMISIGRAVVRRLEGRTRQRHFGVAFEFSQLDAEVKKSLHQIIHEVQRVCLQNRLQEQL